MKFTKVIFSLLFGSLISAEAATYAFNNGSSATANGIVDATGRSFRSGTTVGQELTATGANGNWTSAGAGVLAVGTFSTDDLSSFTTGTQLISAFNNQFGPAFTFGAGPSGQRSSFAPAAQTVNITGSAFNNQFMYLFAGNGSTFETSSQFLVLKHNTNRFLAADDANPNAITVQFLASNSTILFGSAVLNVPTTNTDSSITPGFAMAAPIPETSTSLLGAIGALALLRRRRN
jgi:hypothetical protein